MGRWSSLTVFNCFIFGREFLQSRRGRGNAIGSNLYADSHSSACFSNILSGLVGCSVGVCVGGGGGNPMSVSEMV